MPSHFTLRMQFGPHQDPELITAQLSQLIEEAPVDEIMFFYFAEEQNDGHETLERIHEWVESSRPYRETMKKAGIEISLNPWHSMLHCDRGRKLKPSQNWQRMHDQNGVEATAVACCLDQDWQEYFLETLKVYAKEDFRVVWIDDDIRYHNHGDLHWGGCFCPVHVAEFNRRAGEKASREEIVEACLKPGEPHPWRDIWMDMWQETILEFLNKCRVILENGGVKMGLMSSSMEAHAAEGRRWEEWWQAFGGGATPVNRPHFWGYSDGLGSQLIHGIAALDQNRFIQPADIETGPEIECFPYGRWNKSFRQTFAQMAVAHVSGSTNLNISLHDFMGNNPDDEPERAAFLKNIRPNMDWLADNFPMNMKSLGVGIPCSQDMGRLTHNSKGKSWFELQRPSRGWAHWLGSAGIAFSARPQERVNALESSIAWTIGEKTLRKYLSTGLLLDGDAAMILFERGFGDLIGLESAKWVTQNEVLYSMEECQNAKFALRVGAQISVNDKNHTHCILQGKLREGAEPISDLRSPRQEIVGHGAFIYQNELGGRVAVVPWKAGTNGVLLMDVHRATQLKRLVEWLGDGCVNGSVEGAPWLVSQFLKDSSEWRGVVWNAGPDEVSAFRVHRPNGMPAIKEAWHLTPSGERLAVSVSGDNVALMRPMHQWELVVLK